MTKSKNTEDYVTYCSIKKVRLLETSVTISTLLSEINNAEKLSILLTAVHIAAKGEEYAFFVALMKHAPNVAESEIDTLYDKAAMINDSLISEKLVEELKDVMKVGKAEERGFLYDEKKGRYHFNANVFVRYFLQRCHARTTADGRLFLYNKKGVYEELSAVQLGKLIRTLMHEGRWNSWNSKMEAEVIKALLRESPTVEEMNTSRNLINLKNGVVSLDKHELFPHHPDYLSTVQLPISYDPNATAPSFKQFLKEITSNNNELIQVHQEIFGYLLSSETKAEKAFFFYGSGANGKSVLASIITQLVGEENISSVPLSDFGQQFGLESLINKTVNIAAENEMGGKALKTENFKAIVSGDTITINIKYRPAISYKPHCKLVFLVNTLPDSMDVTNGFFRKLMLVPFNRTFKQAERNVNLTQELLSELPGILIWGMEGLKRLRENNYQFSKCNVIEECHQMYNEEQNPVIDFFHEHVALNASVQTKQSDFHEKYLRWLAIQGIDDKGTKSKQKFWRYFKIVLGNEGIPIKRKKVKGTIYFEGIEIVDIDNLPTPQLNGNLI